mmetsp:Transcript_31110/g.88905  ORF Transcript_31110/g.88905 Transcript_31110/m.88905 type:complete len:141 (+) Transcript_31110:478-900(+)
MKTTPLLALKLASGGMNTKSKSLAMPSLRNVSSCARASVTGTPRIASIVSLDADGSTLDSVAEGIEGVAVIITAPVIGVLPPSLGVCPGFGVLSPLFLPSEAVAGNAEDVAAIIGGISGSIGPNGPSIMELCIALGGVWP